MKFKDWFFTETRKELGIAYRNLLKDVPQDPVHHPEIFVLNHIKLVRKAIPRAISELKQLKTTQPFDHILANVDFILNTEEFQILILTCWLHDIGKKSATTINPTGKIQSIGHENPEHYLPQLEKLKELAPPETVDLYLKNAQIVNFLIENHMLLMASEGFSAAFLRSHFQNGQVNGSQEMKLLLILMWADKMGRMPEETILKGISNNTQRLAMSSNRSAKKYFNITNQTKSYQGNPAELYKTLKEKGVNTRDIFQALKRKFGLSDEEINNLTNG